MFNLGHRHPAVVGAIREALDLEALSAKALLALFSDRRKSAPLLRALRSSISLLRWLLVALLLIEQRAMEPYYLFPCAGVAALLHGALRPAALFLFDDQTVVDMDTETFPRQAVDFFSTGQVDDFLDEFLSVNG